nr:hypothetical protein Itr_chr11CG17860 [Ipomoea trifida]
MQPYDEENMENKKNKILARIEELKQEMANIREGDSFDSSNDDDENCVDTCENNSFVPLDDNDVLESFTFDNESLSNELANELHDMLCNVDEELNVDDKKEENDGDLRDLLLSSEKEEEKESVIIEKENEEQNFENKDVMIEEVHCKIIEEEKEKTRNESVREEVEEKAVMMLNQGVVLFVASDLVMDPLQAAFSLLILINFFLSFERYISDLSL